MELGLILQVKQFFGLKTLNHQRKDAYVVAYLFGVIGSKQWIVVSF